MEGLRKISLLLILVATLHLSASHMMLDSRTGLNIPEKILGVIDIVQNHKNKPGQTPQYQQNQGQSQQYQPQYPQYWNQPNYQGQAQYQNQNQGQQGQQQAQVQGQNQQFYPAPTQGTYPQNVPVYPQPQPTYPQYPVQNGQSQAQGQFQYPNGGHYQGQNQQGNGQYQGQNQHGNGQYQGQNQQGNGQYQGQNQQGNGQYQGQNQQGNGQYQGQAQQGFQAGQNQYPNQAGQFQGQTQATGQYGQESQFQAVQSTGSQTSGFQVTGGHGGPGPACVCQAWTKPKATKGEAGPLEKTDVEVNEVPVRM